MSNKNLHLAKKAKNDEWYTQISDIDKEIQHYRDKLKGLIVYCPCDDYRWSNFVKYFKDNFEYYGLKGLVATNYDIGDGAWKYEYDGKTEHVERLQGNGDFRSEECTKIKDECDIVITNPAFSTFREYVKQLMDYGKKFIIIGNQNAITYKEIFPYIKDNKMWLGGSGIKDMAFKVPSYYEERSTRSWVDENGQHWRSLGNGCWFTNVEHTKRHDPIDLYKRYSNEYKHYDNYDAIECGKVVEIPMDYDGVMGVPITFLDKYCPEQFEIVGISNHYEMAGIPFKNGNCYCEINGVRKYVRIFIKRCV